MEGKYGGFLLCFSRLVVSLCSLGSLCFLDSFRTSFTSDFFDSLPSLSRCSLASRCSCASKVNSLSGVSNQSCKFLACSCFTCNSNSKYALSKMKTFLLGYVILRIYLTLRPIFLTKNYEHPTAIKIPEGQQVRAQTRHSLAQYFLSTHLGNNK